MTQERIPERVNSLHVVRTVPNGRAIGIFIFVHGSESHSGWFSKVSQNLAKKGYITVCYDRIGWGQSPGKKGCAEPLSRLSLQLHQFLREAAPDNQTHELPVHIVGLSWGGLLVLHAAARGLLNEAKTLHVLVPGLFPNPKFSLLEKIKIFLGGILGLPFMVDLPWKPADFSTNPDVQSYILKDQLRTTRVSAQFLWRTFLMQQSLNLHHESLRQKSLQFILAENDGIIDTPATAAFAARSGAETIITSSSAHAIVLDSADETAEALHLFASKAAR